MSSPKVHNQSYQPPLEVGIKDKDGETILTLAETARHLEITTRTVHRLLSKRQLTKRRLPKNRRVFVTLSSIIRYRDLETLSPAELILRVIALEEKVGLIIQSMGGKLDVPGLGSTLDALRRNHPELYQ